MTDITTQKISLAKGLKVLKRLTGRLVIVERDIRTYNSTLKGAKRLNVEQLLSYRTELKEAIVSLKAALYKGNSGIQEVFYRTNEIKASLAFFATISTREGVQRHDFQNTEVEHEAYLTTEKISAQNKELEREIDGLQDQLDAYNASTKIQVNQRVLELAS